MSSARKQKSWIYRSEVEGRIERKTMRWKKKRERERETETDRDRQREREGKRAAVSTFFN